MKSKFLLVMGIIYIIFGVCMLAGAVSGEGTDALSIIDMIVFFIGGIMGVMYCAKQEKAGYCFIVGIISLIIAIIVDIIAVAFGSMGAGIVSMFVPDAGAIVGIIIGIGVALNLLFPILYVAAARKFMKKTQ